MNELIIRLIDGQPFVRMAYAYPDMLADMPIDGRVQKCRVPAHPTRPARVTDVSVWWEPLR